jgi:hypothetical protein
MARPCDDQLSTVAQLVCREQVQRNGLVGASELSTMQTERLRNAVLREAEEAATMDSNF